ncbi:MAG: discoidin domain-containing protein, partial [Clostridia bacterium]|nr:discoidin domain-containing protein [Clostridia bacterium]
MKVWKCCLAAIVAAVLCCALIQFARMPEQTARADTVPETGIDGLSNVALFKQVTATSSYVPPEGFFDVSMLVDGEWETYANGNVKLGWNSDTLHPMGEYDPVDITLTLDAKYDVQRIVLKPMKWASGDGFPKDYELQHSLDGGSWTTLISETGKSAHADSNTEVQPVIYDIDTTAMKYFRIHITRHGMQDQGGAYFSSLGELELYGKVSAEEHVVIDINKNALLMNPGEIDWLKLTADPGNQTVAATFKSGSNAVARVSADGTVTAVAGGSTVITVTDTATGKTYECAVTVKEYKPAEKFQIVAFIPYFYGSEVTAATFDNLKNGGITNVELNFALDGTALTRENILKALALAYERGLDVTVSEQAFNGNSWPSQSDEAILEFVKRYSHIPGVAAYYVTDEPANSVPYARAIALIKSVMPYAVAHMNYCGAYEANVTGLQNELKNKYGLSLDYVMYDAYTFTAPACNEGLLYSQLEYNRNISKTLGVPGATYIQAMSWNGNHRPNANEIRYQVFASLAGGVKQISYFCWKTPRANSAETYGPAVIDIDNNPTDLFAPVSEINARVQKLGPTLMQLETYDVFHTGTTFNGYRQLPGGFLIQPVDYDMKLTLSHMEDASGQVYVMLVNRDYKNGAEVKFTLDSAVKSLSYISDKTGKPVAMTPDKNGVYTVSLLAGDGILLQADAAYRYEVKEVVNLFYLNKAIAEAEALDLGKYKSTGKDAFNAALAEAKRIAADETATQTQVDKAQSDLLKAQGKLIPYAQDGVNLALGRKVTAANSYEDGTYWAKAFLTDGVNVPLDQSTNAGWSVDPFSGIGRNDPVEIKVDLEDVYLLETIILKPCIYNGGASMPSNYKLLVSADGKNWTEVAAVTDLKLSEAIDQKYTFDPVEGRYVKVAISRHSEVADNTGTSLSQIGELEVYGREPGAPTDTPAATDEPAATGEPTTATTGEATAEPVTTEETAVTGEPAATDKPTTTEEEKAIADTTPNNNDKSRTGLIIAIAVGSA